MSRETRVSVHWTVLAFGAVFLVAAGALAAYLLLRSPSPAAAGPEHRTPGRDARPEPATPPTPAPPDPNASLPDVTVTLTREAVTRAGIKGMRAEQGHGTNTLDLPGMVEPNAYRQVAVTPVTTGRITRVLVELGDRVRKGQPLAQLFSPELADAQREYISARAELEAHDRELRRTTRLVEIGAASRQELEKIEAEHTARTTAVRSTRSRLTLLGVSERALETLSGHDDVEPTATIPAPIDGVVTERIANVGLNVDPSSGLFTVVDLSTVWVVAAVYEKDFSRVRTGTPATVTTDAYPGVTLPGRVGYIDPQLNTETRTARARVEVPNPRGQLRLGMYAQVHVDTTGQSGSTRIPRSAVQNVGDRQVVYLMDPQQPGTFVEREVRLGQVSDDRVEVVSGVRPGDLVVSQGSFFVRAERERLGLRPSAPAKAASPAAAIGRTPESAAPPTPGVRIVVGEKGFDPARVSVRAGVPVKVTFVRTTDKTCATEILIPSLKIRRALPLDQPVVIDVTPQKGALEFTCGMNMLRGSLVVE